MIDQYFAWYFLVFFGIDTKIVADWKHWKQRRNVRKADSVSWKFAYAEQLKKVKSDDHSLKLD